MAEKKTFNKSQYNIAYNKQNYKRLPFNVRPEFYEQIREAAERRNMNVSEFIRTAIIHEMEKS